LNLLTNTPKVSISIVSHLQAGIVQTLLADINKFCAGYPLEVILTLNLPEIQTFRVDEFSFPIYLHLNAVPKGFGENHNQAFIYANSQYFCVMNPDIRLSSNPFDSLVAGFVDATIGVMAPLVLSADGTIEDSVRQFPTFTKILKKVFTRKWTSDYVMQDKLIDVDWTAGMFMLFPHGVFERIKGFNQRYFLYYEDVDICARLHLAGLRVVVCPAARVVHDAQRTSHRNLKYLRWHLRSMLRFLTSAESRQLKRLKRPGS
jgi:GT2 family glycosyltransferase